MIYTLPINLSQFQSPTRLFDYAYAKRNNQSDDLLRILVSDDCGLSWTLRKDLTTDELPQTEGPLFQVYLYQTTINGRGICKFKPMVRNPRLKLN